MVAKKIAAKKAAPTVDPDLVPQDAGIEQWKNTTAGMVYVTRIGDYGKKQTELIGTGRVFAITPQERRLNQNGYASPEQDMFQNGTLAAVSLIDGEPDTPKLRDNPNMVDEKEIPRMFKLRGEHFADRIELISNPATISRLLELARDPRLNATVQQFEQLRRRERAIAGRQEEERPTPAADTLPKAVTPR